MNTNMRIQLSDDELDMTVHDTPDRLFELLNLEQHVRGTTIWKTLKTEGFRITFFKGRDE